MRCKKIIPFKSYTKPLEKLKQNKTQKKDHTEEEKLHEHQFLSPNSAVS